MLEWCILVLKVIGSNSYMDRAILPWVSSWYIRHWCLTHFHHKTNFNEGKYEVVLVFLMVAVMYVAAEPEPEPEP
ncbi:hypothetical protein CEXT_770951 [Caerostris extrusa]|uniref:Uncharacterized protein n=1 Tax=Caerostris extrusa TaxID=172846 RepID=A0AAV4P1U1_CAEEX|nr:hypothetical protein CEXT_770951 [Caerostris extrusa]